MAFPFRLSLTIFIIFPFLTYAHFERNHVDMNVIDRCWRNNPNWDKSRMDMAMCTVGFSGKMKQNQGRRVIHYEVTDSSDDVTNPRVGTLRYGATMINNRTWITFKRDMTIRLERPIYISNHTAIDGRGAEVHIAYGSGFVLYKVRHVIIHGLHIHDIKSTSAGKLVIPGGDVVPVKLQDLDAIRLISARKVWIDHNTFERAMDGLIDVTQASSRITMSNNRFMNHDKVMLLGHDDSYSGDREIRVTLLYNHFGPECHQRMPRIRYGYVHIANNLYQGWDDYAIGGGMDPTIMSEGNKYIATGVRGHEAVAWKEKGSWHVKSVGDEFDNGAIFSIQASEARTIPRYGPKQKFTVRSSKDVMLLTKDAGALNCRKGKLC